MKKKLFYYSLLANVVLVVVLFASYYFLKNIAQSESLHTREAHQARRRELFEVLPKQHREVIMLGDGLIEEGNWAELLQNPKVRNRGIRGDMTTDILKRLRDITDAQPTQIHLYIGGEDLANRRAVADIIRDYEKILVELKLNAPGAQVWAQGLLPINFMRGERHRDNKSIQAFNQKLEALCARFGAKYVNLYPLFVLNAQLNDSYTNDGLHLNGKGYQLWAKQLNQSLPARTIQRN